jgi:1-acyl-sn-glycerol-3-phosphate acyltransferase
MLYKLLQFIVRFCLKIFCSKITIHNKHLLHTKGPLLIVANHPNSFFDAIVIAAFFKQKVYSLARGDAFNKPWHKFLLKPFNMIPIYRISEGKENLEKNYQTFVKCKTILANNGIVLIFIEGVCKNTHQLLPFKKGAARIVEDCLQQNIPLKIMPLALGYSSFNKLPLSVHMQLQNSFLANDVIEENEPLYKSLNQTCFNSLNKAIKIPQQHYFGFAKTVIYLIFNPIFKLLIYITTIKTKNTVFYHSVLFAFCFLLFILLLSIVFIYIGYTLVF